jgi:hypothetical protein
MPPVPYDQIIPAAIFGVLAVAGGGYLVLFANRYRDWTVRQLQKAYIVPLYRGLGVFAVVAGLAGAWSLATEPAASQSDIGPRTWTGDPIIKDELSAIRVAHALAVAQHPNDRMVLSEVQWLANCHADLKDGVWRVRYRGRPASISKPHYDGPAPGWCSGATVFYVDAKDGRYMGELFVD